MLVTIILNTVAVPFAIGLLLALVIALSAGRTSVSVSVFFPLLAALIYCLLEGIPSLPPVGAKQKLPLLLPLFTVLSLLVIATARRLPVIALTALFFVATSLAVFWIGQNVLLSNPAKFTDAAVVIVIAFLSSALIVSGNGPSADLKQALFIPAALSASFGAAILAALGAFLGMAQANGALAAMLGGFALVSLILQIRGRFDLTAFSAPAVLSVVATTSLFAAVGVLLAPKVFSVSSVLASASLLTPFLISAVAGRSLSRLPAPLRFVVGGLLTVLPSALAICTAALASF